jgi:hypothetical protein
MVTEQLAKATDTKQMGTVTLFTKNSKAFENDKENNLNGMPLYLKENAFTSLFENNSDFFIKDLLNQ